jgi:hypothetical protein
MLVRCISTQPTEEQAQRLGVGKNYFPGKQQFGVAAGEKYLVFGLSIVDGETWIDILLLPSGYLHSVPLILFEILDRRLSKYWVIGFGPKGNLIMRPSSIVDQPYYFDDLSNGVPEVVEDFREVKELLEAEF